MGPKYTQIRQDQAHSILEVIQEEHKKDPSSPGMLLGDLNITDVEPKGQIVKEYTNLSGTFFSSFHDLYLVDHDVNGKRTKSSPIYLANDLAKTSLYTDEPTGSFYNMMNFGNGQVEDQTRYDYCLLYKSENFKPENLASHSELRRFTEESNSTDHLPLTVKLDLETLFASYAP